MKNIKLFIIFMFAIFIFIPVHAKAATIDVNSAIVFKALLSTGADMRITDDFTIDGNYPVNAASTVDLNGHTINFASYTLLPYESLTIMDTSSDQSGQVTGSSMFLFQVGNSSNPGSLTINGGTFISTGSYGVVRNYGTFVLNGGQLQGKSFVVYNQKGSFEMNGGEIISSTGVAYYGGQDTDFVMNDGLIRLTGDYYAVSLAKPGATATINNGTIEALYSNTAETSGGNAIAAFKDTEVTINGGTISAFSGAIIGNGSESGASEGTNAKFNINGGTISSVKTVAIYAPQIDGVTVITGGTLNGKTCVEVRAGTLIISGGTFNADTENYLVSPNSSGSTTLGAAVSVAQHTTKSPIQVTITGGIFNGYTPFSETNPQNNNDEDIEKITLDISGGVFNASSDTTVTALGDIKFISGGDFTNNVTEYVVDGYGEKDLTSNTVRVLPYRNVETTEDTNENVVDLNTAFPGEEVIINPEEKDDYEIKEIIVKDKDGNAIEVNNNKFIMPDSDVTISVKYTLIYKIISVDEQTFNLTDSYNIQIKSNGDLSKLTGIKVDGNLINIENI